MKVISCIILLLVATCSFGQDKRGIAYGYHSPEDLEVLSPALTWWYNWSETPEASVANVYTDYGFDFVPMTWNGAFDSVKLVNFLADHPDTKYLLAFNEPNFLAQASMTPSEAAAIWPKIESIADAYDLVIVGPAVNFCGGCVTENGTTYTSPFDYLDDFFAACEGCRVDHIAIHSYMNNVAALDWYINEFKKYNKPIWVTEFAGWEQNGTINNPTDQINFMVGAVDLLEADTTIYRYSWFIGRGEGIENYPYIDILGANGELTDLGEVYVQMPVHSDNTVVDIPARIEAESYNRMDGILLELTRDATGFANVGYIESGDWLEYKVNVAEGKTYPILFRYAATANSSLDVLVDGVSILTQSFTNTNGWQNWQTANNTIELEEGIHTLRLQANTSGFNINWFQIGDEVSAVDIPGKKQLFEIFPNPVRDQLNVKLSVPSTFSLTIYDILGNEVYHRSNTESTLLDVSKLASGQYSICIDIDGDLQCRNFVKASY